MVEMINPSIFADCEFGKSALKSQLGSVQTNVSMIQDCQDKSHIISGVKNNYHWTYQHHHVTHTSPNFYKKKKKKKKKTEFETLRAS